MTRGSRPGKYTKLAWHLQNQDPDELEMSFLEVATVIGAPLPKPADRAGWWTHDGKSRQPHRIALLASGFQATLVECEQRVRFKRTAAARREREGYGKYVHLPDGSAGCATSRLIQPSAPTSALAANPNVLAIASFRFESTSPLSTRSSENVYLSL